MVGLRIPGLVILFLAFAFSFLVSVSLPSLPALDIARTHYGSGVALGKSGMTELRFGIWAFCYYDIDNHRTCSPIGHGYTVQVLSPLDQQIVTIGASWTRGLAVHPIATAAAFVAFVLAFGKTPALTLGASLTAFFAALMTLIAFSIDIALYAYVNHEMAKLGGVTAGSVTGPGFWLTFISLILLMVAGCTVCFGRRSDGFSDDSSFPMKGFFSKFSRN